MATVKKDLDNIATIGIATQRETKDIRASKPPLLPVSLLSAYDEIAALAKAHEGPIDIGYQELVFRHAIQGLEQPASPWEIAHSIPKAIRNSGITDANIVDSLMGINGSFYRLLEANALTTEERTRVSDLRSFLATNERYQGMFGLDSSALRKVIDTGITVMETMPADYTHEEKAIILTGGLKYLAEGFGFLGTRKRILPKFGGKWDELGITPLDMLVNQHRAITQFPQETRAFVVAHHNTSLNLSRGERNFPIEWPEFKRTSAPRKPISSIQAMQIRRQAS